MSLRCEATDDGVLLGAGSMELSILEALPEFLASIDGSGVETNRLHPAAYPDDAEAEREFQRLVADDLDALRQADATALAEITRRLGQGPIELDVAEAESLLRAVGAARLTLAARAGLFDLPELPEPATTPQQTLVQFLGIVQDSLVEALSARLDA
ncbi:MAG: DUF2017 family protein [Actinobacteria bacterium]|nr:DUF2017 family protein [Actinomycetota bacterium]